MAAARNESGCRLAYVSGWCISRHLSQLLPAPTQLKQPAAVPICTFSWQPIHGCDSVCLTLPRIFWVLLVLNLQTNAPQVTPSLCLPCDTACVCLQQNAGSEHKGKFSRLTYFYSPSGKANSFPVSPQLTCLSHICVDSTVMNE